MIKFPMKFFDVLFPLKLNPLSYRCPEELQKFIEPGMIVSAPLKNRIAKGIVIGASTVVPRDDIKNIQKIHTDLPILNNALITLLKWMSEYYMIEKGIVLKNMLPKEAFTKVKQRKKIIPHRSPFLKGGWGDYLLDTIDVNDKLISNLIDSIQKRSYRTFLFHAPSSTYERSFVIKILSETGNAIILIPEVSQIDAFYFLLHRHLGERVCLFHSSLSKGERSEAIQRLTSGVSDIVVGTRSAIFAPLKDVSFIAVLHEHSSSYKQREGLRYSGRDVAVMRGFLEKATVLLSSICPSIESFHNCRIGKYTLIRPNEHFKKTRVRILDIKQEKFPKPYLSRTIVEASKRNIQNNKKIMFLINRRGHSTLLQCTECNYVEECPHCKIPLVLHKIDVLSSHSSRVLKCHYCGYMSDVPERCSRCQGYHLKLLGAGTQKVQEDIESLIGIKTLRIDSDAIRKRAEIREMIDSLYRDDIRIIIGTKLLTAKLPPQTSKGSTSIFMAAILNADILLNLPDFRANEKAFQEISMIIDKIEPQGEIFIQTGMPYHYLYKCIKKNDFDTFFKEELIRRKTLNYPPFSRLLLIKFVSKRDIFGQLSEIVNKTREIIPPHPPLAKGGRGDYDLTKGGKGEVDLTKGGRGEFDLANVGKGDYDLVKGGRVLDDLLKGKGDYEIKGIGEKVEILGPSLLKTTSGENEFRILLKSSVRGALHSIARKLIEACKDSKDIKIKVDVDPISI